MFGNGLSFEEFGRRYRENVAAQKQKELEADPVYQLEQRKKAEQEAAQKLASRQQELRLDRARQQPFMGGSGFGGTILTGPLGIQPQAPVSPAQNSTLLTSPLNPANLAVGRKSILGG